MFDEIRSGDLIVVGDEVALVMSTMIDESKALNCRLYWFRDPIWEGRLWHKWEEMEKYGWEPLKKFLT